MRILSIITAILLFTSCVTQKKVKNWLDDHPTEAAGYCADKFPPDTVSVTVTKTVDSSGYAEAYINMAALADSLFYKLDSLQHIEPGVSPVRINFDSLRKSVDKEIRKRLKPCVDSIQHVYHTIIDKARETQLRSIIDEKDKTITARDNRITELEAKVKAKNKWIWMFWILVAIIGAAVVLRIKRKLPFVVLILLFTSCLQPVELPKDEPVEKDTIPVIKQPDTLQMPGDTLAWVSGHNALVCNCPPGIAADDCIEDSTYERLHNLIDTAMFLSSYGRPRKSS